MNVSVVPICNSLKFLCFIVKGTKHMAYLLNSFCPGFFLSYGDVIIPGGLQISNSTKL